MDTGDLPDAASVSRLGAEMAYRRGPFLVQAEYIRAELQPFRTPGQPGAALDFQGGYVEAALVLNGEGRAYALAPQSGTTYATFQGVAVPEAQRLSRGGIGVFEVAARYSAVDLDARGFRGGMERDVTLGLSWYPEPNLRLIGNVVHGRVQPGTAQSETRGTRPFSVDTVIARLQIYW